VIHEAYKEHSINWGGKIKGHQIGNHSYGHSHSDEMYYEESKESIEKAEKAIKRITGVNPKPFFRAPYGEWSQYILKASNDCGYMYNIYWSIDPFDWKSPPTKTIVERVFKRLKGGDIVLMHGHGKNSVYPMTTCSNTPTHSMKATVTKSKNWNICFFRSVRCEQLRPWITISPKG
jgi:peptidoglycan/xylan/chitin deacetylase (PgdA/CDA1 family)